MSVKVPIVIGAITLVTAIATGLSAYYLSKNAMEQAASRQLESTVSARNSELRNYLDSIKEDLLLLASSQMVKNAFAAFDAGYSSRMSPEVDYLRDQYIKNNPYPVGEKHKLDSANDGSAYSAAHGEFHPWLRRFLEMRGYYDVFLTNRGGDVIYSVFKENDYATNLKTGPWHATDLARVVQLVGADPGPNTVAFTDFSPYGPSANAPASFIAAPLFDASGEYTGALVFQMPVARINKIMHNNAGMGSSGETYLVGSDFLMRTDSRFLGSEDKSSILSREVKTSTVASALAGTSGVSLTSDYRGISVLSAYEPFSFEGVTWALMAEMDREEVLYPVIEMRNLIAGLVGVVVVIMVGIGIFFARSITAPLVSMTEVMGVLAGGNLSVVVPCMARGDELGSMARAVQVFKDNASEVNQLRADQEANAALAEQQSKAARMELADSFQATVGGIVKAVASAAANVQVSAQTLSATSEQTTQKSIIVTGAAEETSANVQTVSSAAEELSSSISEITRQALESTRIAEAAFEDVEKTNGQVSGLIQASDKIEDVIALITDIAEQTNLLALNATIEAARAGDAGRGFAVVASEVKELASQTARATEDIGAQIKGIQDSTQTTVSAIQSIGGTIRSIREISCAIASAVEEQGSATQEIARNIEQVANGTVEVTSSISSVNQAAGETGRASEQLLIAATDLSSQSEVLNSEVGDFLEKVRSS